MDKHRSGNEAATAENLKAQYIAAIRRRSDASFTGLTASDKREHEFFLQRLRFRLKKLGLSSQDIQALEKNTGIQEMFAARPPARSFLHCARTAMLVIHGIGEQNPYETLDQFARNLTRYLRYEGGIEDLKVSAHKITHNDWVEAMIRLETDQHGPESEAGRQSACIDLYEYYWAPETEDKISYTQTISWLMRTTLTPIRVLDQNVILIEGEPDSEGLSRSAILLRELRRIALLYIPVLALLVLLGWWLPSALNITGVLQQTARQWSSDHPIVWTIMTVLFAISLVMYWVVLKQLVAKWLRWLRQQTIMVDSWVTTGTFLAGVAVNLLGIAIGYLFKVDLVQYVKPVLNVHVLLALAALGVARMLQLFLAKFVGDVAVYVNADSKTKDFAARRAILNGAATAIVRILKDEVRGYDQFILAGHSLGSVIAYDSLNELMNRCQAGANDPPATYATPDQIVGDQPAKAVIHRGDLSRIMGLVTFGSPLDKVQYFFRENVPKNQSVRAQIISLLHSFRTRPSGRDYGIYRLEPYLADQLSNVKWLNAWSKQDPVSGMLHFYEPIIRQHFDYLIPIYAHLSYWEDLRFYAFFSEPLLLGKAVTAPPKVKYAVA
jgi:hypothetical protein